VVPATSFTEEIPRYAGLSFGEIPVNKIFLIQSRLEPFGPVYADLREFRFT
jgi:2'-5' RNA ligase